MTFATARLGVVLVPLNFMLTAGEVRYILDHAGVSGLVAEDVLVETAEQALRSPSVTDVVRGVILERSADGAGAAMSAGWEDVDDWLDADERPSPTCGWRTTTRCA